MILSPAEISIQRTLTKAFIDADSESLALEPNKREPNGSGGYILSPQPPRLPQTMRLIAVNGQAEERMTLDGAKVRPGFMLMGEYNASVERWDRFVLNGKRYEVLHVQEKRDYMTKCEVTMLGDV